MDSGDGELSTGLSLARTLLLQEMLPTTSLDRLILREQVASLIQYHGMPIYLLDGRDPQRDLFTVSQIARCDWLAMIASADISGRSCPDRNELNDRVEYFRELATENRCFKAPRVFASAHTRLIYFHGRALDPDCEVYDDTTCEVIVMSGLPGSGKDHWIQCAAPDWPVVSLDAIRSDLNISPDGNQGAVVNRAKARACAYLRARTPFIWNATNTTTRVRRSLIQLLRNYHAQVRIVYVEAEWREMKRRNGSRRAQVPHRVIDRLTRRLDVPNLTESHTMEFVASSAT